MATVTERVKEALIGADEDTDFSEQTKRDFLARAVQDSATEEYYMTQQEFVDAIAPAGEDYVSLISGSADVH